MSEEENRDPSTESQHRDPPTAGQERDPSTAGTEQKKWWKKRRNQVGSIIGAAVVAALALLLSKLILTAGDKISQATGISTPTPPFIVTVSRGPEGELNECNAWMFRQPITDIPVQEFNGTHIADTETWVIAHGGVDASAAAYSVTIQGTSDQDVILSDIRVKVLARKPALTWPTLIFDGLGCGGRISVRNYSVNLDDATPQLVLTDSAGSVAPPAEYTVSKSDPEVMTFAARVTSPAGDSNSAIDSFQEYIYVYQIDWRQGSESGTIEVDAPNGKPFELTPYPNESLYQPINGSWTQITPSS